MGDAAIIIDPKDEHPTMQFPKEWTLFTRSLQQLDLGIKPDHTLFTLRLHSNLSLFGRPSLVLHAGPSKDGPRVGMCKDASLMPNRTRDFDVYVPAPASGSGVLADDDGKNVKVEVRARWLELFPAHAFSVVAAKGVVESFEWRHKVGGEVADLVGDTAAGWVLVRGASTEVVAVWATQGSKIKKEALRFRLLNSGASGELGSTFESAAVHSALGMWDHVRREKNTEQGAVVAGIS